MSSSVHDMSPNGSSWDHRHRFTTQQQLLLEDEVPYLLAAQDTPQGFLQRRPQHILNGSLSQYNSLASNQYDPASTYQQRSPSFATSPNMTPNPNQSLNSVSTTFTFAPPDYTANSARSGYQTAFQSGMGASSAPSPGTHNQLSATSAIPSGPGFPMQFPYPHQLPIRQSEIQSQIIDSMHATMTQQSKRQRGNDDSHHLRTAVPDPQELLESANKPKPCALQLIPPYPT
jgi:hypothetical protein